MITNMIYSQLQLKEVHSAYLHEKDVSCGVSASMYNKCLLLDVTATTGPYGKLTAIL